MFLTFCTYKISLANAVQPTAQESADAQEMVQAYQKQIEAAEESLKKQQQLNEGKDIPEMAKEYQQGLEAVKDEMLNHKAPEGDAAREIEKAYQDGLKQ